MSDFARQDEAIRVARGPFTQRQAVAGASASTVPMLALESAVSIAVAAGNAGMAVRLPPTPVAGDIATIKWTGNACKQAQVIPDAGATPVYRIGPTYAGEMWQFRFSGGAWQAIGP